MARRYIYTNAKTGEVIFDVIRPNYVSMDDVDKEVLEIKKIDPRITPFISRQIRVVPDLELTKTSTN